jgi:hypothetical protein
MARSFQWKIYEQSKHIQWIGRTWHLEPKGGTMVLIEYLGVLALVFLFSLAWQDQHE